MPVKRLLGLGLKVGAAVCLFDAAKALFGTVVQRRKRRAPCGLKHGGQCWIVTTAALPWRTGTAINPALRAAYLAKDPRRRVTLVVPWLPLEDQRLIFPYGITCKTKEEQAAYIRQWAGDNSCDSSDGASSSSSDFDIVFYDARYYPKSRCIFATEDIMKIVPKEVDCVILEEPEHLNWYYASARWSTAFKAVVGVIHTNYSAYARACPGGIINLAAVGLVSRVCCRVHCHKVVKLSELAEGLARSVTCNVHGVGARYIAVGAAKSRQLQEAQAQEGSQVTQPHSCFSKGAYFLGKALWDKGHRSLIALLADHDARSGGAPVHVDVYGVGEDLEGIRAEAARKQVDMEFKGLWDHIDPALQDYKLFINPCTKDVVATSTAEALAMGKWVLVPDANCNVFFSQFANCLVFKNSEQFGQLLEHALAHDPHPMSAADLRRLSWEAATERLLDAASIAPAAWTSITEQAIDGMLWRPYRVFAIAFKGCRDLMGGPTRLAESRQRGRKGRRDRGGSGGGAGRWGRGKGRWQKALQAPDALPEATVAV